MNKIIYTIIMAITYTVLGHLIHLIPDVSEKRGVADEIISCILLAIFWLLGVCIFGAIFSDKSK